MSQFFQNKIPAIQQLVSILLTKYGGLDSYTIISVSSIIGVFLSDIHEWSTELVQNIGICIIIWYLIYKKKYLTSFVYRTKEVKYNEYIISNDSELLDFTDYMLRNPAYFDILPKFKIGNAIFDKYQFDENVIFNFDDKTLNAKGCILTVVFETKSFKNVNVLGKEQPALVEHNEKKIRLLIRTIKNKNCHTSKDYCDKVMHKMQEFYEPPKVCWFLPEKTINNCLHTHTHFDKEDMKQKYLDSYFSTEKNKLWNIISKIWFHPEEIEKLGQFPTYNLLMYGPPGTGKSTFAYRIANCLDCDIYCVNLLQYILKNNVAGVFDLFHRPKTIFLLDEFDMLVDYLTTIPDFEEIEEIINGTVVKTKKYTDKFRIKDLLTLFQGAIPIYKRFIFACTNDFERIKIICPALFRAGRLNPILFDNLNWKLLNEVCQYFFKKQMTQDQGELYICTIPTSEIIELAIEYSPNNFEIFEKKMLEKLKL